MATITTITTFIGGGIAVDTVVSPAIVSYVTGCCGAAVTGVSITDANPAGVACKACYMPADARLDDAWFVGDNDAWARCAEKLEALLGLPTHMAWNLATGAAMEAARVAREADTLRAVAR